MPWFKVDDNLAFHAKTVAAGNAAMGLWVRAGSWCAQQLTDGQVPTHMVAALGATAAQAKRLVEAGLWLTTDDGYTFHQWDERQPSAEEVRAEQARKSEAKAAAGRLGGIASGVARRKHTAKQDGSSSEADAKQNEAPTRPDPTRPGSSTTWDEEVEVEPRETSTSDFEEDDPQETAEARAALRRACEAWHVPVPDELAEDVA